MNAQLKPISVMPLARPVYRRMDLLAFPDDWKRENAVQLREWYETCSSTVCDSEPAVSYEEFADTQHDLECERQAEYRDALRSWRGHK